MWEAKFQILGLSPYSQSAQVFEPRKQGETPEEFEKRCWRMKMHTNKAGNVVIPPMAVKSALGEAARFLSLRVPGKGKATYTKHFEAGLLCMDPVDLGIRAEDVQPEWLSLSPTGKKGGMGVPKCFPRIDEWEGECRMVVLDGTITKEALEQHLRAAGQFIGLGRFRPRNGGFYGRFRIEDLTMEELKEDAA